jgi:murein L,D-transpeptidase YafK
MVKGLFKRCFNVVWAVFVFLLATTLHADVKMDQFVIEPIETNMSTQDKAVKSDIPVDYVVVEKSARKLFLYAGVDLVKTYNIALGKQPEGQKQREGDSRTPEGLYTLDWRNPNSKFYRSIHVSYPSISQKRTAREAGVDPGGAIMIHGQPNDWSERIKLTFANKDWTEGCIALENQDMIEVWDLVKDGTPIEIKP